jgi:hypothetical protein
MKNEHGIAPGSPTPARDRLTTLRAHAALSGIELHAVDLEAGGTYYLVHRWGLSRELASLDSVSAWLDMVTGAKHG